MISAWWLLPLLLLFLLVLWQRRRMRYLSHERWRTASDLRALEEKLRLRSDRLDALFATVNEAIIRLDHEGTVLTLNEQARRVFRLPRNMQMPQPMAVCYRQPKWIKTMRKALKQMPEPCDIPDIHIGDHVLAVRLAPLGENEALLLCLDISRQRELEAQRDQLMRDLMHDLKTPLTSILGYARSIESFGGDAVLRNEAANTIVQESKRLNRLIESMLTLDQLGQANGSGGVADDARCDGIEVLRELEQLLRPLAEKQGVSFSVAAGGDCSSFPMDGSDLHRLLTNIIENAIRHTPEGGKVSLDFQCKGGEANIRVVDEGRGIDPRHLPHVTERFYRAEEDRGRHTDTNSGGHGMGLTIVQETVNRYGGRLVLANRPEGGLQVQVQVQLSVTQQ